MRLRQRWREWIEHGRKTRTAHAAGETSACERTSARKPAATEASPSSSSSAIAAANRRRHERVANTHAHHRTH